MSKDVCVATVAPVPVAADEVILVASGDLRQSANEVCWPAQHAMEQQLAAAFAAEGIKLRRGHEYDAQLKHGFIYNQRMGMDVFEKIHPDAPIVVAESVWQYSHHVLAGLLAHRGPILTVANWSGEWPGLVGMLNLNACLRKFGKNYSTLWSKNFTDDFFRQGLKSWIATRSVKHDLTHVHNFSASGIAKDDAALGSLVAAQIKSHKSIIGVFDEGCMGMMNGIIEDHLMNPAGFFKERLSQSALYAAMREVRDDEAARVRAWLDAKGVQFKTGPDEANDLTDAQILEQCRMYIAALRIADSFGCDAIGIQYQQGLKDICPASDLVEGLLNNVERPPAYASDGRELYAGKALPHFNEVDECVALDAVVTNRIWCAMDLDPATTLHDVRYGEPFAYNGKEEFIWLFQISGAVPASHLEGGYAGAVSERQPPMYFRLGGGTLKGICKPGEVVWSRVYVDNGKLAVDLGRAQSVSLPAEETHRRWVQVNTQWPIMHVKLTGVSQNQFMAQHASNHVNVAYAPTAEVADKALAAKAVAFAELGFDVRLCGVTL